MLYLLRWKKFRGTPTTLSNLFDDLIGKFIQIFRRRCAFSYRLDISLPSYFQLSPRLSALGRISRSPRGPSLRGEEKGINFSRRFPTNVSIIVSLRSIERSWRDCILKRRVLARCIRRAATLETTSVVGTMQHGGASRVVERCRCDT